MARVGAQVFCAERDGKIEQRRQMLRIGRAGLDIDVEAALADRLRDELDVRRAVAAKKAIVRTIDVESNPDVAIRDRAIKQIDNPEVRVVHQSEAKRIGVNKEVDRGKCHQDPSVSSAMESSKARA